MAFKLKVVFSGPCLYVVHPDNDTQVAVLMPDAREKSGPKEHPDGEPTEPHVGFIRINLADVRTCGIKVPPGTEDDPVCEIVHRFEGDVLIFDDIAAEKMTVKLENVPNVEECITDLRLIDGLFEKNPPDKKLVMRTILKGGTLTGPEGQREWRIPRLRSPATDEYKKPFATGVTWERDVVGDSTSLMLRIVSFDGTEKSRIPLGPFDKDVIETVTIQVANLCALNPLEWDDLPKREVMGTDEDFKWIYHLLEPAEGYRKLLKGSPLPAPRLVREGRTGDEDCMGAQITRVWPVETTTAKGTEYGEQPAAGDSSR